MPPILIVDDDDAIRATLHFLFENEGYRVIEANGGVAALAVLRASQTPMVMLIDLNMPEMNGIEVLRALDAGEPLALAHRFMLLTARRMPLPPADEALLHQMQVQVVHKPFELNDLLAAVATIARAIA